jgi:hypothetical protein
MGELNKIWSNTLGIMFELLKWETDVRPAFGPDPQSVINEQIGEEYDVFIGIFWGRLGTSTPRADSGTVEEFKRAYARFIADNDSLEIMLYFKDSPIAPSKIDPDQLKKVQDFKKTLSDMGGLFSEFEDELGFESSIRAHLTAIAQKFTKTKRSLVSSSSSSPSSVVEVRTEIYDEDDYGYIDYIEIYESRMAEMESAISLINEATVRVGEQLASKAAEIKDGAVLDAKAARRIIKRTADDLDSFSSTLSVQVTVLSSSRNSSFNALTNALAIQDNFSGESENLQNLKNSLFLLIDEIATAKSAMSGMRDSTVSLPRISKELNKAKRLVVAQLDLFLFELENTSSTLANIIGAIDKMIIRKS